MSGLVVAFNPLLVEVVYAQPNGAVIRAYAFAPAATVADALRSAAADPAFPVFDPRMATAGIYGRIVAHDTALSPGDRVEIYRPLSCDPKMARRIRARARR